MGAFHEAGDQDSGLAVFADKHRTSLCCREARKSISPGFVGLSHQISVLS